MAVEPEVALEPKVGGKSYFWCKAAVGIALSDSDLETCELTFAIVNGLGPSNGTLSIITNQTCDNSGSPNTDAATVTYTPNSGFAGVDSFDYTVTDGDGASSQATVTITVNALPEAQAVAETTDENVAVGIALSGSDLETCELTFAIVNGLGPSNGTLSIITNQTCDNSGSPNTDATTVTYTPNSGFAGVDSFDYTVTDGDGSISQATVTIEVLSPNPPKG